MMVANKNENDERNRSTSSSGEDECSDDDSYDYGFADDEDGNGEEEYEVDYGSMNVSPEILRMLGAPDDVIAAKEAEISGIKWVAPEVTGLEHSDAIADFQDVAIAGDGNKRGESKVKRVYAGLGEFDNKTDATSDNTRACPLGKARNSGDETSVVVRSSTGKHAGEEAETAATSVVVKLKVMDAPQAVPKTLEFKLPPTERADEQSDNSGSDVSWDEVSVIDGKTWWEAASDEDIEDETRNRMSPNLLAALGLATDAEKRAEELVRDPDDGTTEFKWHSPTFSGLKNSNPLTTLHPLLVGDNKDFEIVKTRRESLSNGDTLGGEDRGDNEGEWSSDDEGWDYEDLPEDDYLLEWSTNISPNLASILSATTMSREATLAKTLDWRPPQFAGLANSAPIIGADEIMQTF